MKQKNILYKILIFTFLIFIVANSTIYATNASATLSNKPQNNSNSTNVDTTNDSISVDVPTDRAVFENITAKSCILMDAQSGIILYNKSANEKSFPASTTKLVTALLALEKCNLNDRVQVSYYAVKSVPATYSISDLKPGETFTIKDLLYTLMVGSSNDSAFVLAQYIANGGNNYPTDSSSNAKTNFDNSIAIFSNMMNDFAKSIGCTSTHFVNPNGIHNENHYSTAYDLALIGKYAYKNQVLMNIANCSEYELPNSDIYQGQPRKCKCTNLLLYQDFPTYYEYANGLKTGYTDAAGSCIVASSRKGDMNLIAVVLGAEKSDYSILNSNRQEISKTSRENICKILFDYGFNNYSYTNLINTNDTATSLNVINGDKDHKSLDLIVKDDIRALVKKDEIHDITPNIKIKKFLAPISKNSVVGTITYKINGLTYSSDLLASHDVEPVNYMNLIIALIVIVLIFLVLLVVIIIKSKSSKSK